MDTSAPIAIITGGSRGLGRSTVLGLAKRGVHSIFTYHSNRTEAEKVAGLAREAGAQAIALPLDTGNVAAFDDFVGRVREALGRLGAQRFDYLVNNAGISHLRRHGLVNDQGRTRCSPSGAQLRLELNLAHLSPIPEQLRLSLVIK